MLRFWDAQTLTLSVLFDLVSAVSTLPGSPPPIDIVHAAVLFGATDLGTNSGASGLSVTPRLLGAAARSVRSGDLDCRILRLMDPTTAFVGLLLRVFSS